MVISRDEFDKGRIDLSRHVLGVFETFPDKALSFAMISEMVTAALGGLVPNEQALALELRTLEAGGDVRSRKIEGVEFWIYTGPAGAG